VNYRRAPHGPLRVQDELRFCMHACAFFAPYLQLVGRILRVPADDPQRELFYRAMEANRHENPLVRIGIMDAVVDGYHARRDVLRAIREREHRARFEGALRVLAVARVFLHFQACLVRVRERGPTALEFRLVAARGAQSVADEDRQIEVAFDAARALGEVHFELLRAVHRAEMRHTLDLLPVWAAILDFVPCGLRLRGLRGLAHRAEGVREHRLVTAKARFHRDLALHAAAYVGVRVWVAVRLGDRVAPDAFG